jgi:type II secretory pathway pseudopilin PulG
MRGSKRIRANGFSVVELLIVVAIILTLTAIITPNFFQARRAAQQATAYASVREISRAEEIYNLTYGRGYAELSALGGSSPCLASLETACLLEEPLARGHKDDYTFVVKLPGGSASSTSYEVMAIPDSPAAAPLSICANRSGTTAPCSATPPPNPSGVNDPTRVTD